MFAKEEETVFRGQMAQAEGLLWFTISLDSIVSSSLAWATQQDLVSRNSYIRLYYIKNVKKSIV